MRTHALIALSLAALAGAPAFSDVPPPPPADAPPPSAPAIASAPPAAVPEAGDESEVQVVHVVEKRPFTEGGRGELSLFAPIQVNTKYTTHIGVALVGAYHIRENLAVQIDAIWNPIAQFSTLSEELINKVEQKPLAADSLLMQGGGLVGLELMPVYGKLNVFDGKILKLGFYMNVGLGVAKTQVQLQTSESADGRTFGDTGVRPMAGLGIGFRVFFTDRFTLRLELRDLVYSAYVSSINGCNAADALAISNNGTSATGLSASCSAAAFGSDIKGNAKIAYYEILKPTADVVNNITAFTGLSFLF